MEDKNITKENQVNIFDLKDLQNIKSNKLKKTNENIQQNTLRQPGDIDVLKDKNFYSCFDLSQRLKQKFKPFAYKNDYKQYINNQLKNISNLKQNDKKVIQNTGKLKLKILETINIQPNQHMKHPFVKIHFIDYQTGKYIKKNNKNQKNFLHNNNILIKNQQYNFEISDTFDVISTNNCDIQKQKINQGFWNEELIINTQDIDINENTLMLFEILDFDLNLLFDKSKQSKLNKYNQYKLYWGYLKINGFQSINKGLLDIQLFKYQFKYNKLKNKNLLEEIPEVYLDFLWPIKQTINACLKININFEQLTEITNVIKNPQNIFQIEQGLQDQDIHIQTNKKKNTINKDNDLQQQEHLKYLSDIMYIENKVTEIPKKNHKQLQTDHYGCLAMKFSNQGQKLAYSVTFKNNVTVIRIFDIITDDLQGDLYFHNDIVHDIQWHQTDNYLMSCSSDHSCKIFKIPQNQFTSNENQNFILTEISIDDYCYSCQFFYPESDSKNLFYVLSSKKGCLYFFKFNIEQSEQTELLRVNLKEDDINDFANCLEINQDQLYVGHSNGKLSIFSIEYMFDKIKLLKIQSVKISDSIINQIQFISIENCLLILSRDNYIRMLNLKNYRIPNIYSNGNFSNSNIKFCTSGDEQIIFSGSQNGKIHFWDLYSADYIEKKLNHSIKGIIAQVSWNKKYNILALGGFGSSYPVCLYYQQQLIFDFYQKNYKQLIRILFIRVYILINGKLIIQTQRIQILKMCSLLGRLY